MMSFTFILGFVILLAIISVFMINLYRAGLIFTNAFLIIIYIVFSVSFVFLLIKWRNAIRASIALMDIVINIMKKYPSIIIFAYSNVLIEILISYVFTKCLIVVNINHENYDYKEYGAAVIKNAIFDISSMSFFSILITLFLFISYLYNKCVFQYVIYTTICDVFASRLFNTIDKKEVKKNALLNSLLHSVTKRFGSICYASLIFPFLNSMNNILKIIKFICGGIVLEKFIYNKLKNDGKIKKIIDYSILLPWTAIDFALKYFNEYSFALLAIRNVSYKDASKQAAKLIIAKHNVIEIKDIIIKYILLIYKAIIYVLSVGMTLAVVISLDQTDEEVLFYFALSVATVDAVFSCISSVLESSTITTFLCYFGLEECLNNINSSLLFHEINGSLIQSNKNVCKNSKNTLNGSNKNIEKTVEIENIEEV